MYMIQFKNSEPSYIILSRLQEYKKIKLHSYETFIKKEIKSVFMKFYSTIIFEWASS